MKIAVLVLLSSIAAMAETVPILEWLDRNPVMVGPEWKPSFPSSEKKFPLSRSEIEIREKQEALWRLHRRHGIRER